jgi:hypothetical protein
MTIYVFGDSYSVEYDHITLRPWGLLYCNWKGYVPKQYYHHLKDNLRAERIINYSISGNDNENIFEKFTEVYKEIKDDDLIIFNWSIIDRFSVDANIDYNIQNYESHWVSSISFCDKEEWVNQMKYNRTGSLYYNRTLKLIHFINETLKPNKVIHWTWDYDHKNEDKRTVHFETGGLINDFHYNESEHYKLYEKMILELKEKDKIFLNLWKVRTFIEKKPILTPTPIENMKKNKSLI